MKDNIRGFVDIEFVYPDGKRELVAKDLENHVNWLALRRQGLNLGGYNVYIPTKRDASSISSGDPTRWVIATGARDVSNSMFQTTAYKWNETFTVNQDYPTYQDGATANDPDLVTFVATITAPTSTPRTIKSIGLMEIPYNGAGVLTSSSLSGGYFTILNLTTPCIQPTNVIVILTYRLYLQPAVEQNLSNRRATAGAFKRFKRRFKDACNAVSSVSTYITPMDKTLTSSAFNLDNLDSFAVSGDAVTSSTAAARLASDKGLQHLEPTQLRNLNTIRYAGTLPTTAAPYDGLFIKKLAVVGDYTYNSVSNATGLVYNDAIAGLTSPLQNIFPQRNTPPGPFQDLSVNNTASMSGSITLNADAWVDPNLQKLMKVVFTGSGGVGVASYKIETLDFIAGFMGNTWLPRTAFIPQPLGTNEYFQRGSNDVDYADTGLSSMAVRSVDNIRKVAVGGILRNKAGINVYDVIDGSRLTFNSSNGLSVSAVADIETSNGYIFVACANTGLWRISSDLTTVEQLPSPTGTNKAYQICVKNDANKTLWVLFDGGVYSLTNPTAAVGALSWTNYPLTYTGISDSNWANVTSMVIDPDYVGASDRFLFVTGTLTGGSTTGNNRLGYVWWDTAVAAGVNPSGSGVVFGGGIAWNFNNMLKFSEHIKCSDGVWTIPQTTPKEIYVYGYASECCVTTFGSNNLEAKKITVDSRFYRLIPATINGIKGFMGSDCYTYWEARPSSFFVTTATLLALPNGNNNITNTSSIEFYFLEGATALSADAKLLDIEGYLGRPLVYLPDSNFIMTHEAVTNQFGVCPLVLPPTHSKFATYKAAMWKSYGWDSGSSTWVLNNPNSKTTHSDNQVIDTVDNIGISFTDGASGVSFVNGEWFITTLGRGLMKDNGTSYTFNFSFSLFPTETIVQTASVPTALGALVDEPITFYPVDRATSTSNIELGILQNKGRFSTQNYGNSGYNENVFISDQLIPASTDFELRFKFMDYPADDGGNALFGLGTYSGSNYNYGLNFRYFSSNDTLRVYNADTLLTSISNPVMGKELKIVRSSNSISCYYDGSLIAGTTVTNSSQFVAYINNKNAAYCGFYDMFLTYTEARRILRVGSSIAPLSGQYKSNFSALTYGNEAGDVKVLIGSGTPLTANLVYTSAAVAIPGTGYVKVAAGAGWLIFHDSEPANPVNITAVAHYVPF